jgi:LmbE family N-acetylglucosaminyl deacetylase
MREPEVFELADRGGHGRRRPAGRRPGGELRGHRAAGCAAAAAVTDIDAVAHLSFGDDTVRDYFWQINSFRALRAHDIARAVGAQPDAPLLDRLLGLMGRAPR